MRIDLGRMTRFFAGALLGAGMLLSVPGLAQAQNVNEQELLAPGALPDMVLGSETAPVTIVEYASMTCPHCQNFHLNTFPQLREKYIDTGQVRFIFREFPLDIFAAMGSMVARCAPPEQFYDITALLFERQADWVRADDPVMAVFNLVRQTGYTEESYMACLNNQELLGQVVAARDEAANKFGVNATPTFFVNGERVNGALPIAEFDAIIARHR